MPCGPRPEPMPVQITALHSPPSRHLQCPSPGYYPVTVPFGSLSLENHPNYTTRLASSVQRPFLPRLHDSQLSGYVALAFRHTRLDDVLILSHDSV